MTRPGSEPSFRMAPPSPDAPRLYEEPSAAGTPKKKRKHGADVGIGFAIVFGSIVLAWIVMLVISAVDPYGFVLVALQLMLPVLVTSWIVAAVVASSKGRKGIATGIVIASGILALLVALCFGLVFYTFGRM